MTGYHRFHAVVTISLLGLGVCGPQTGTGSGSGADTATGATSAGSSALPEGCACRLPDEDGFTCLELVNVACEAVALCPQVVGRCMRANPDMYPCEDELQYNEDALVCALEALRDRTPGTLTFEVENSTCGLEGCGSDEAQLTIGLEERAVVYRCTSSSVSVQSRSASRTTLAEPDHFSGCLELTEPPERYRCLFEGVTNGAGVCE